MCSSVTRETATSESVRFNEGRNTTQYDSCSVTECARFSEAQCTVSVRECACLSEGQGVTNTAQVCLYAAL